MKRLWQFASLAILFNDHSYSSKNQEISLQQLQQAAAGKPETVVVVTKLQFW